MDFEFDIDELTIDTIGSWPMPAKIALCIIIFVTTIFAGYWFDTKEQMRNLAAARQQEQELRSIFESKQKKASNLLSYKLQLVQISKSFGAMLRRLPSQTEVPGLLEDISKTGIATGLEFKLFDPQNETRHDFYAELPINIAVVGTYHQFGEFVSHVASLHRIVTLHDFKITNIPNTTDKNKPLSKQRLMMEMTAKTYRYVDPREKLSKQ